MFLVVCVVIVVVCVVINYSHVLVTILQIFSSNGTGYIRNVKFNVSYIIVRMLSLAIPVKIMLFYTLIALQNLMRIFLEVYSSIRLLLLLILRSSQSQYEGHCYGKIL